MSTLLTILNAVVLLGAVLPLLGFLRAQRTVARLSSLVDSSTGRDAVLPRLSAIVPARNEERGLRAAVGSMLGQDYPDLELVLVDDRSTDGTGRIMAELAAAHPGRAAVITVARLPVGWLGKNHALWVGSRRASGEWLLCTDADIVFDPTCFRRAVAYAMAERIDHLTLFPRIATPSFWLNAFVGFLGHALVNYRLAYRANDPRSNVGIGIGAFNLIRREAYAAIGTHAAISLRPDEDIRLGMRVKRLGLRQRLLNGTDLLRVEWYRSLRECMRGLEKNLFASLEYRLRDAAASVLAVLAFTVWPFVGVWITTGTDRYLLLGTIVGLAAGFAFTYWHTNRRIDAPLLGYVAVFPISALLFCYAIVRSTWVTLAQGGIRWRDTFYPLGVLRGQSGLE